MKKTPAHIQRYLFPEMELVFEREETRDEAGKRVVRHLLSVRQKLATPRELEFIAQINYTIRAVRSHASLSDSQRESLVLIAIEQNQANTLEDICDDTKLSRTAAEEIVLQLHGAGIVEIVPRLVAGRKKPMGKLIFSLRKTATNDNK